MTEESKSRPGYFVLEISQVMDARRGIPAASRQGKVGSGVCVCLKSSLGFLPFVCINTGWGRTLSLPLLVTIAGICDGEKSRAMLGAIEAS